MATHRQVAEQNRQRDLRNRRIAENRGPIWPAVGQLLIEIVAEGTVIRNERDMVLCVDRTHVVQKGDTLFITQAHWDLLIANTEVRQI